MVVMVGAVVRVDARDVPGQSVAQAHQQETKIEGKVCNAAGEGIAGATLWLEHDADTAALEVVTGADGKYEFVVAGGGRYKLKVMKDGFRDAGVDPIQVSEGGSKKVDVILEKEGAKAEVSTGAKSDSNGSAGGQAPGKTIEFSDEPNFTAWFGCKREDEPDAAERDGGVEGSGGFNDNCDGGRAKRGRSASICGRREGEERRSGGGGE